MFFKWFCVILLSFNVVACGSEGGSSSKHSTSQETKSPESNTSTSVIKSLPVTKVSPLVPLSQSKIVSPMVTLNPSETSFVGIVESFLPNYVFSERNRNEAKYIDVDKGYQLNMLFGSSKYQPFNDTDGLSISVDIVDTNTQKILVDGSIRFKYSAEMLNVDYMSFADHQSKNTWQNGFGSGLINAYPYASASNKESNSQISGMHDSCEGYTSMHINGFNKSFNNYAPYELGFNGRATLTDVCTITGGITVSSGSLRYGASYTIILNKKDGIKEINVNSGEYHFVKEIN
ncbi:hypothetical protein VHA01S_023_00030 [Vibrio halioticoli NBRC 102217]|uniref:Lipoprotein n=1 Tax=Vibrio halioticoli NBRC 102217 TaxID=1219072 RepID=V5F355_9VIBR|nr:hypothetical protein [Vibrio halioticoli]GAD89589.1 hypothetical protein VHA01S_023_00030 [Vibrio halioticoli NBRC 102217]